MSRPAVTVVMPFAGTAAQARAAVAGLDALAIDAHDELVLADNAGVATAAGRVRIVPAPGERSPSRARNAGARHAQGEWILFLDSDCEAPPDLLDRFFAEPIDDGVGALAGAVVPAPGATGLAARYGEARSFLDQGAHLAHPFMPRAVAANLLVRRAAFEEIGGFFEGVRAAEDTDFSWRLQRAGWRLEGCPAAAVTHRYRATIGDLRRQWRGYAAGRAWLGRRYDGFAPQPAVIRAASRIVGRRGPRTAPASALSQSAGRAAPPPATGAAPRQADPAPPPGRLARGELLALDVVLGLEELAGFVLSNRPAGARHAAASVVLVADRFPAPGDPLADLAMTLANVRVEAAARPETIDSATAETLVIDYREDDGAGARLLAVLTLAVRHPLRCLRDLVGRPAGSPSLTTLAPAVRRLRADRRARVHPMGGEGTRALALRLARLAGRRVEHP